MSINHFEKLARSLAASPSRRAFSQVMLGLSAGSFLAPLLDLADIEAKKKHKHKHKKKHKKKHQEPPPPPPPPQICLAECAVDGCCDAAADEVCKNGLVGPSACLAGGCPPTGLCTDSDFYVCWSLVGEISCVCATPIDGAESVCIDPLTADCGSTCTSSSDCGEGSVCIAYADDFCACDPPVEAFCAALCDKSEPTRADHQASRLPFDLEELKRGGRKRPNHR